jgi:hypothetical protein
LIVSRRWKAWWSPDRWPRTDDEWAQTTHELASYLRHALRDAAIEIGESGLADEIHDNADAIFPSTTYVEKLNMRSKGAGNRAYRRAMRSYRRSLA